MIETNPILGILFFILGGLTGPLFPIPLKWVRGWSYETYWMIYAAAGMLMVPVTLLVLTNPGSFRVFATVPRTVVVRCGAFGVMWGFGGLAWGLMIRYLGIGLGLAIGCGICASLGTVLPPVFSGHASDLISTSGARIALCGVAGAVLGIVLVGMAGRLKEHEQSDEQKRMSVAEFAFKKGLWIAIFAGVMSAGQNLGLQGGADLQQAAVDMGADTRWSGVPVQVLVLGGGFLVNAVWCLMTGLRRKSLGEYIRPTTRQMPILNFALSVLAGVIWVGSSTFMKFGEPLMGEMKFISFAVVMSSAVLFASVFGVCFGEWRGTSPRARMLLAGGISILVLSFAVISAGRG